MSSTLTIRIADPAADAPAIAEIYAPAVHDIASFETDAPDAPTMAERIRRTLSWSPWLVAAEGDRVVGYACATRHRERAGYRWAVDLSVYVAEDRHGRGIGKRLYRTLLPIIRLQGFLHAYAGITSPNPASMALHTSIGMRPFATFERVGWKHGAWWDVGWYHMLLVPELPETPAEPVPLPDLLATPDGRSRVQDILDGVDG